MRQLGRRRFLYGVGGFGVLAGLSSALLLRTNREPGGAAARRESQGLGALLSITRKSYALGSTVSMTAVHRNESTAHRALDAAFAELELIEDLMSIYRPNSQLSRLNRDRTLNDPHPCLLDILRAAQRTSEMTNGAFDITIQPLWDLYAMSQKADELPSEAAIEAARSCVDWQRVELGSNHVKVRGDGTKITLNGIAQGYAADRVAETLRNHGVDCALIDTGEINALGAEPRSGAWTIGIQHPRDQRAYISLAELAGRCLATSGDYATTFGPDYQHHHLFDPRTGRSPTELSSVSIAADTALQADALSTAVFVMGLDAGAALIRETSGADAMLIAKDGRMLTTAGFPLARPVPDA